MFHLTNDNLDIILNAKGIVIVDCWAPWCSPCRAYSPIFEKVAKTLENEQVVFVKWNIDDQLLSTESYGIRSVPTTLILGDQGRLVNSKVGIMIEQQLLDFITNEI